MQRGGYPYPLLRLSCLIHNAKLNPSSPKPRVDEGKISSLSDELVKEVDALEDPGRLGPFAGAPEMVRRSSLPGVASPKGQVLLHVVLMQLGTKSLVLDPEKRQKVSIPPKPHKESASTGFLLAALNTFGNSPCPCTMARSRLTRRLR